MAVASSVQPDAGPSTLIVPKKRVATFHSDTSDAESIGSPSPSPHKRHTDGVPKRTGLASVKGTPTKKKRVTVNGQDEESKRKRKVLADKLFETRKELPFYQGRREILEEIMAHDTTIILGETGCGKSTQLPQLLRKHAISLEHYGSHEPHASRFVRGPSIAVTQPRRLPTIALANRVADEMGCFVGGEVGYSVRFEEAMGRNTKIRYLTEGVLMRELSNPDKRTQSTAEAEEPAAGPSNHRDEGLNLLLKYDIIIIDEAHERTLNTDFLCGALKRIQRTRKRLAAEHRPLSNGRHAINGDGKGKAGGIHAPLGELKIVIMSATLDPSKFQAFFGTGREALLVKGRMYDVHTRYSADPVDDYIEAAARQALQIHCAKPEKDGDILMFMPGSDEIESCCELLRRIAKDLPERYMKLQILPLYSALPPQQQSKIFAAPPERHRRVVVATNIAETSITIPGVTFVIDSGFKKEKEYIFRKSGAIEHLSRKSVSKAAAWQRTGRAGREREGDCYRLFTRELFDGLAEYELPEIQRCNLASAILQLVAMRIDPFSFEYIDTPGLDPIHAAFQSLAGLGALKSPTEITALGRDMLRYPLDPEHARILIASFEYGCPSEIIDILSLMVAGQIWIDRSSDRDTAATARAKFIDPQGDHMTALRVLQAYEAIRSQRQSVQGEITPVRWCKENFVNQKTLVGAIKIRDQLRQLAERNGRDWRISCGGQSELVTRSLLQGLFMNTAIIQPDGSYRQTAGTLTVFVHPSSVLMSKKVPAIVFDELAVTTKFYARGVSAFEQAWLGEIPWFQQAAATASVTRTAT